MEISQLAGPQIRVIGNVAHIDYGFGNVKVLNLKSAQRRLQSIIQERDMYTTEEDYQRELKLAEEVIAVLQQ